MFEDKWESNEAILKDSIDSLLPNQEYEIEWEILRPESGAESQKIKKLLLNGTNIGGCNPSGNDNDCEFYECRSLRNYNLNTSNTDEIEFINNGYKIKADENGKINIEAHYTGNPSDCYCVKNKGECLSYYYSKKFVEGKNKL